jgi:ubiquinone biosynthesis protein
MDLTVPVWRQAFEERRGELLALALPFQVLATMLAVVVLELLLTRPPRPGGLRLVRPIRSLRRKLGVTLRGWQVLRIATRHGLAPALGLKRGTVESRSPEELGRRARLALEDAGGMFVKLGQLLASRSDLLPASRSTSSCGCRRPPARSAAR